MAASGRNIIVIGASAGGLDALDRLLVQLPGDLPAAIFIVQHMAPGASSRAVLTRLGRHENFRCKLAEDGERFEPGHAYLAPADRHLLLKEERMFTTKGARENRYRPGIDPLFRSAAVAHGSRVIGVLLSGMLDDGTAGLSAIHRCGGVTIVQDPEEAEYSGMPRSALTGSTVDYSVGVDQMGALLDTLSRQRPGTSFRTPRDIRLEAKIAERVLSSVEDLVSLGALVPFTCPNCCGTLREMKRKEEPRYRCHTGHAYTAASLFSMQTERIEETLWVSLRMFEERRNLLRSMTGRGLAAGTSVTASAEEVEEHIQRLRAILLANSAADDAEAPNLVSYSRVPRNAHRRKGGKRG